MTYDSKANLNQASNLTDEELTPEEQEKIAGGAFDAFLYMDGIAAPEATTTDKPEKIG